MGLWRVIYFDWQGWDIRHPHFGRALLVVPFMEGAHVQLTAVMSSPGSRMRQVGSCRSFQERVHRDPRMVLPQSSPLISPEHTPTTANLQTEISDTALWATFSQTTAALSFFFSIVPWLAKYIVLQPRSPPLPELSHTLQIPHTCLPPFLDKCSLRLTFFFWSFCFFIK